MTAQKGDELILKIGDGSTPTEVFSEVGGLINTNIKLNNNVSESNNISSGAYRTLVSQSGIKKLVINGTGYFTDSGSEELLRGYAFSATSNNYELHFGNGDKVSGAFIVSYYERKGNLGSQEDFSVVLESASNIIFTIEA